MPPADDRERLIEEHLGERYELVQFLGKGGFAAVYKVRSRSLERLEALKVLLERRSDDQEFANRFRQEARLAASLDHPNIIRVFDFGQIDDFFWYSMQLVNGPTIHSLLASAGRMDEKIAAKIAIPVLDALDYSHERGVVHRDIKPENLILDQQKRPYVMDFGIAKAEKSTVETRAGFILGSPAYLSPEQAKGEKLDGRTDIYSFGTTLYEMLSGTIPFTAKDRYSIMLKRLTDPPTPLSLVRPHIHPRLEAIVMRSIAMKREDRFATAGEMRDELDAFLKEESSFRTNPTVQQPQERETTILASHHETAPVDERDTVIGPRSATMATLSRPSLPADAPVSQAGTAVTALATGPTQSVAPPSPPPSAVAPAPAPAQQAATAPDLSPLVPAHQPKALWPLFLGIGVAVIAIGVGAGLLTRQHADPLVVPTAIPVQPTAAVELPTAVPPTAVPATPVAEPVATPEPRPTKAEPKPTAIKLVLPKPTEPPPTPSGPVRRIVQPPLLDCPDQIPANLHERYRGKFVGVLVTVNEDGSFKVNNVVSKLCPECDAAALEQLRGCTFTPAKDIDGNPVKTTFRASIPF